MKERFRGFAKEVIPAVNVISEAFAKSELESEMLTITLSKDGYVVINPDYTLGLETIRINANDTYKLKSEEPIE